MNTDTQRDMTDAPERYELGDEPFPQPLPIRADLFRLYGPGVVVLVAASAPLAETKDIEVWLHLGTESRVTVGTGKAEVGQNIRTSLAQAVSDELPVSLDSIQIVLGDTDLSPFDMGTFGSRTTPFMAPQVRRAAATVREMLIGLAAEQWQVDRAGLTAEEGRVCHAPTGRVLGFGQIVQGRRLARTVGPDVAVTTADRWKVAGTSAPKADGRAFVTGRHRYRYTSDCAAAGMLWGRVLRPPVFGAVLRSVDMRGAEALPGVVALQDGGFAGVAAPTATEAERALRAVKAEWDLPPQTAGSDLVGLFRPASSPVPATLQDATGHYLRATYTLAYLAHVPLEPRAALAVWEGKKLTVWTGTQRPFGVREELAVALNVPEAHVRVIVPDTGSGYGGKHTGEAAVEASRLARAAGRPVKMVWTREEEFTAAYLRPAGVIEIDASTEENGTLTRWECHNYNSGSAGIRSPYRVPNQSAEFHEVSSPLRQGSYRALAATGNHFARESHMDDLAHAHGWDPLAFRLHNLEDDRMRAVLTAAAERFGWEGRRLTPGHGFGIACGTEKGSYIANCVEVAVAPGTGAVRVVRITAAYECGAVVNPKHLESQVEGAVVMGMGGALFEAIHFDGGRILNPCLSAYRVPRFGDVPPIDIVLLDRKDLPSVGAGETPIVAIAPAIGGALFDATGVRLRALPLAPSGLRQ